MLKRLSGEDFTGGFYLGLVFGWRIGGARRADDRGFLGELGVF